MHLLVFTITQIRVNKSDLSNFFQLSWYIKRYSGSATELTGISFPLCRTCETETDPTIFSFCKCARAYACRRCCPTRIRSCSDPSSCIPHLQTEILECEARDVRKTHAIRRKGYFLRRMGHLLESSGLVWVSCRFPRRSNLHQPNLPQMKANWFIRYTAHTVSSPGKGLSMTTNSLVRVFNTTVYERSWVNELVFMRELHVDFIPSSM